MFLFLFIIVLLLGVAYLIYNSKIKNVNQMLICDSFYLENKAYYDTIDTKVFNDNNLRDQLFPNFKRTYPALSPSDCILDIGSNIGEITEIFHKYYQKNRIFLAEPLDFNCELTKKKFASFPQILTIHTAIGLKRDAIVWKYNGAGDMMGIKRLLPSANVTFLGLDNYYDQYAKSGNVFFLKIDVEGYEDEVLFTGKKLLSGGKVKFIYFEYHRADSLRCKTSCSSLVVYLEQYGYHCYLVGKYNMIRITSGCFMEIDSQKLAHVVGIKDDEKMEKKFVDSYNKLYSINKV